MVSGTELNSGWCVSVLVMKAVLTPEWVNNQVFSLVSNEQCLAVPLQ